MGSWKEADDIMGQRRFRLVVKAATKKRLSLLFGPRFGVTEDQVVSRLIDLAVTLEGFFPVYLDNVTGAPTKPDSR